MVHNLRGMRLRNIGGIFALAFAASGVFAQTPKWAGGYASEYDAVCALVSTELSRSGARSVEIQKAGGTVRFVIDEPVLMNLYNVFVTCMRNEKTKWPALVGDFVSKSIATAKEQRDALALLASYEKGKSRLYIKIYPLEYMEELNGRYIGTPDFPGTVSAVVIDMPSSIIPLDPSYLEKWKKGRDEVISEAKANTFASLGHIAPDSTDLGSGQILLSYWDEGSIYVASLALDAALLSRHDGGLGVFVGIPARSVVIIQPIGDKNYVNSLALNTMMTIRDLFQEQSGSISSSLYWFHKGIIHLAGNSMEGALGKLSLPQELSALMSR
jgi:hypothetical protein